MALINKVILAGYIVSKRDRIDKKGRPFTSYVMVNNESYGNILIQLMAYGKIPKMIEDYYRVGVPVLIEGKVDSIRTKSNRFKNVIVLSYVQHCATMEPFGIGAEGLEKLKEKLSLENGNLFGEDFDIFENDEEDYQSYNIENDEKND